MNRTISPTDPVASGNAGFAWTEVASEWVLAIVLTFAVYHEIRGYRLPNGLTITATVAGLGLAWLGGSASFYSGVAGLVAGYAFLGVFYLFGGVGGGDLKFMGAVGSLMGFERIQPAIVFTAILGGVMAVLFLVWHRDFWGYMTSRLNRFVPGRRPTDVLVKRPEILVPYGLAIAGGSLLATALPSLS